MNDKRTCPTCGGHITVSRGEVADPVRRPALIATCDRCEYAVELVWR